MYISFSDIPGHHNLFLDYLYEFDNVKKYFSHDFRDKENYLKVFKSISDSRQVAVFRGGGTPPPAVQQC